jgi:SAM-dependent methyltransferase
MPAKWSRYHKRGEETAMIDPTRRFSSRVDTYIKYRPSYPPAILDLLRRRCGLAETWDIADIGSGPGNLTRLFLDHGNRVFGVEPNPEMREAGERLLSAYPRFSSITGTAEATTLADRSVDLVVAGQAFHWFDRTRTRPEFQRILRSPRWVALIWNERRIATTPFLAAYEQLLLTYGTDYTAVQHRDAAEESVLSAFFGSEGYSVDSFENVQRFDFDGLRGRLLSSSYVPEAGHPKHQAMLHALPALFERYQMAGVVSIDYDTKVYYGRV